MSEIDFSGVALVVTASGTLVTAIGIAVVAIMTARQKKIIDQVEKQGNSAALELKRTTAAALRTVAVVSPSPANALKAKDAETLYEEAKKQAEQNAK